MPIWSKTNPQQTLQTPLHLEKCPVWCGLSTGGNSSKLKLKIVTAPCFLWFFVWKYGEYFRNVYKHLLSIHQKHANGYYSIVLAGLFCHQETSRLNYQYYSNLIDLSINPVLNQMQRPVSNNIEFTQNKVYSIRYTIIL